MSTFTVWLGVIIFAAAYAVVMGPVRRRYALGPAVPVWRQVLVYVGLAVVLIALASPLDELADETLFSAHMLQHMLLTYVAPPLWLAGTPGWLVKRLLSRPWMRSAANRLVNPISAFIIFNGLMWAWHIPALYDAALQTEALHIFQHLIFMTTATIGWWPVVGPALSALIAFANRPLYPFYGDAPARLGLTALADQQWGAVIMWLPAYFILLAAFLVTVANWLQPSLFAHIRRMDESVPQS
jgi:putative membrane protein